MAQVSNHCVHTVVLTSKSFTNWVPRLSDPLRTPSDQLSEPASDLSAKRILVRGAGFMDFFPRLRILVGPLRTYFRTHLRTPCEANPYKGSTIFDFFPRLSDPLRSLSDPLSDPPLDTLPSESLRRVQDFGLVLKTFGPAFGPLRTRLRTPFEAIPC